MGLSKYKIEVTLSNLILTEREIQFIKVILWVSNHSYCTLHSTYSIAKVKNWFISEYKQDINFYECKNALKEKHFMYCTVFESWETIFELNITLGNTPHRIFKVAYFYTIMWTNIKVSPLPPPSSSWHHDTLYTERKLLADFAVWRYCKALCDAKFR